MMSNVYTNSTRERVRREVNAEKTRKAARGDQSPEELRAEAARRKYARELVEGRGRQH
jgi:hypothetical protein